MGKNKRQQLEVLDTRTNQIVLVDSVEEIETYKWLLKALEMRIVKDFKYQPCSFTLSEPVKYENVNRKSRTLFQEHIYSPDFLIEFDITNKLLLEEFKYPHEGNKIYVDVKGEFARNGGNRSFSLNQKWMFQKYGIYIYKLVPKKFFKKMGITEELRFTNKTKKISTKFSGYPLITDIFG